MEYGAVRGGMRHVFAILGIALQLEYDRGTPKDLIVTGDPSGRPRDGMFRLQETWPGSGVCDESPDNCRNGTGA